MRLVLMAGKRNTSSENLYLQKVVVVHGVRCMLVAPHGEE
jgi:hypothetical protein